MNLKYINFMVFLFTFPPMLIHLWRLSNFIKSKYGVRNPGLYDDNFYYKGEYQEFLKENEINYYTHVYLWFAIVINMITIFILPFLPVKPFVAAVDFKLNITLPDTIIRSSSDSIRY